MVLHKLLVHAYIYIYTYMKTITNTTTTATPARRRTIIRMGTTIAATGVAGPAAPGGLVVVGADGACTHVCVCIEEGGRGGEE